MSDVDSISLKPAPWHFQGYAYILVYWFSKAFILENGFVPPALRDSFCGGPSVVILVNYAHSDAGPYDELLFIPGRFRHKGKQYSSITKIYVSTQASIVNGRKNWGIPKEMAHFKWQSDAAGRELVAVSRDDAPIAQFTFKPVGPTLPVSATFIPLQWRTLMQPAETHLLFTKLESSGKVKIARCADSVVNGNFFPDLLQGRLLAAGKVTQFEMLFPVAKTSVG